MDSKDCIGGKAQRVENSVSFPVGVVVEWRRLDNPWQDHTWVPVDVIPGVTEVGDWRELDRGPDHIRYLCASLDVELHRSDTEAYRVNLSNRPPVIYIVLRATDVDDDREVRPAVVTASPYEAQEYLHSGEESVEAVPMPEGMVAWVQEFIDCHHVDEPFRKRKRGSANDEAPKFGKVLHPIERRFYDKDKP